MPVSYTHLDVYKRQLYDSGASSEELDQFCRGTVAAARDGIIERGAFSAGMISGPVSYTHLDVYKRQCLSPVNCRRMST